MQGGASRAALQGQEERATGLVVNAAERDAGRVERLRPAALVPHPLADALPCTHRKCESVPGRHGAGARSKSWPRAACRLLSPERPRLVLPPLSRTAR